MDISSLQPKKMEPWFEVRLHELQGMDEHTINAHLRSMLSSQKHDYKADLRLVLSEKEYGGQGDPWDAKNYKAKGLLTALQICKEVVIRTKGGHQELLVTLNGKPAHLLRPLSGRAPTQPAEHVTSSAFKKPKRELDF